MSNRRKQRAERAAAVRCPRCRCRRFRTKVFEVGYLENVCSRCGLIFAATPSDGGEGS